MPETATDTESKTTPGTGHAGQTFLVGDEIYLRQVEEGDAKYGMSWMATIFPKSPTRVEKWITEEMKEERRSSCYIIVRKSDDRPVGSVKTARFQQSVWVTPYADRLFGEQGDRWLVEALGLVIPWIVDEQHRAIAHIEDIPVDRAILLDGVRAIGMRENRRFREAFRRGDRYIDVTSFEYLNRQWVNTLGDPNDVALERTGTGLPRPVSPPVPIEGQLPRNAMRVGERVYLRPLQKADAKLLAEWSRREDDTNWDNGRNLYTTVAVQKWFEQLQEDEPQDWVRFAVCLRETDEMIGAVGVDGIDYQHRRGESESEIFRPDYRGGGFGSEAKHLLFDYAFNTLNLHSLQSWVFFPNTRSAAALRKQGYREAGRENWLMQGDGEFRNFGTYDLLAAEWRAMPRRETGES